MDLKEDSFLEEIKSMLKFDEDENLPGMEEGGKDVVPVQGMKEFTKDGYKFSKTQAGYKCESPEGKTYYIKKGASGWVCDCTGYKYRGACKHVKMLPSAAPERHPIANVNEALKQYIPILEKHGKYEIVGSYRRGKTTAKDIDILMVSTPDQWKQMIEELKQAGLEVVMGGPTIVRGWLNIASIGKKIEFDVNRVDDENWPLYLIYRTGSAAFNVSMRTYIKAMGGVLSEEGLWLEGKKIPVSTEEDVFKAIGLPFVPPNKREEWPYDVVPTEKKDFPAIWVFITPNESTPKGILPIIKKDLQNRQRYSMNEYEKTQSGKHALLLRVVTSERKDLDEIIVKTRAALDKYRDSDKLDDYTIKPINEDKLV